MARRKGINGPSYGRDRVIGIPTKTDGRDSIIRPAQPVADDLRLNRPVRRNQPKSKDDEDDGSVVEPGRF